MKHQSGLTNPLQSLENKQGIAVKLLFECLESGLSTEKKGWSSGQHGSEFSSVLEIPGLDHSDLFVLMTNRVNSARDIGEDLLMETCS